MAGAMPSDDHEEYKREQDPSKQDPEKKRARRLRHVKSPHFSENDFNDNGFVPPGSGQNAVQVYYERADIRQDRARLTVIQEDDLVRICTDLSRLREVMIAYSRTNYRPGNVKLILDWYHQGIPEKHQHETRKQHSTFGIADPNREPYDWTHGATPEELERTRLYFEKRYGRSVPMPDL